LFGQCLAELRHGPVLKRLVAFSNDAQFLFRVTANVGHHRFQGDSLAFAIGGVQGPLLDRPVQSGKAKGLGRRWGVLDDRSQSVPCGVFVQNNVVGACDFVCHRFWSSISW